MWVFAGERLFIFFFSPTLHRMALKEGLLCLHHAWPLTGSRGLISSSQHYLSGHSFTDEESAQDALGTDPNNRGSSCNLNQGLSGPKVFS